MRGTSKFIILIMISFAAGNVSSQSLFDAWEFGNIHKFPPPFHQIQEVQPFLGSLTRNTKLRLLPHPPRFEILSSSLLEFSKMLEMLAKCLIPFQNANCSLPHDFKETFAETESRNAEALQYIRKIFPSSLSNLENFQESLNQMKLPRLEKPQTAPSPEIHISGVDEEESKTNLTESVTIPTVHTTSQQLEYSPSNSTMTTSSFLSETTETVDSFGLPEILPRLANVTTANISNGHVHSAPDIAEELISTSEFFEETTSTSTQLFDFQSTDYEIFDFKTETETNRSLENVTYEMFNVTFPKESYRIIESNVSVNVKTGSTFEVTTTSETDDNDGRESATTFARDFTVIGLDIGNTTDTDIISESGSNGTEDDEAGKNGSSPIPAMNFTELVNSSKSQGNVSAKIPELRNLYQNFKFPNFHRVERLI